MVVELESLSELEQRHLQAAKALANGIATHNVPPCEPSQQDAIYPQTQGTLVDRQLCRCLIEAVNLRDVIQAIEAGKATLEQLVAHRLHIHDVFGAPISWGYRTPIGDALQKLYRINYSSMWQGEVEPLAEVMGTPRPD